MYEHLNLIKNWLVGFVGCLRNMSLVTNEKIVRFQSGGIVPAPTDPDRAAIKIVIDEAEMIPDEVFNKIKEYLNESNL